MDSVNDVVPDRWLCYSLVVLAPSIPCSNHLSVTPESAL